MNVAVEGRTAQVNPMSKKRIGIVLAAVAAGALAGCGGGGGGGNVRDDPVVGRTTAHVPRTVPYSRPPGATTFSAATEYQGVGTIGGVSVNTNWGLEAVKAADAYARLETRYGAGTLPGAGQRIAVIDTGIDVAHPEIAPAQAAGRLSYTRLLGARTEPYTNAGGSWMFSHGTAVSSLILAAQDGQRFHGIAHGARLDVYGISLGTGSGVYNPLPATRAEINGYAQIMRTRLGQALSPRPGVVNMSFGASPLPEQYLPQRADMERWLAPLIDRVRRSPGTIFVAAAGNNHRDECARTTDAGCASGRLDATSPSFDAALPLWDSSGEVGRRWVAVVATGRTNGMAVFPGGRGSNRCGLAARWCLAAPGTGLAIAYTGPGTDPSVLSREWRVGSGTSYAAPLVSGGLAIVKQYFGNALTMEQVLQRVYDTADLTPDTVEGGVCPSHLNTDDDPECELSSTHGRGLMNLERATRPVGRTSGHGTFADVGGAVAGALFDARVEPVVFDSLGYPFRQAPQAQVRAAVAAVSPIPAFIGEAAMAGAPRWHGLQWRETEHDDGWAVAFADDGGGEMHTTGLAWKAEAGPGEWQAGLVRERDRVHGGEATGSWAGGGFWHHTTFLRAGRRWQLAGDAEEGVSIEAASTVAHGAMRGNGVLRETNGVYTGHAVHFDVGGRHGRTRLTLESPLRAEAGEFTLKVPVGGTLADGVRYADVDGDLAPEAREVRLTGRHEVEGRYGRVAVAAGMRFNAGHLAGEEDWHAGVRWRVRF